MANDSLEAAFAALRSYLDGLAPGPVTDVGRLVAELAPVWSSIDGADVAGMETQKLRRMENPEWKAPVLRFGIERHGGIVLGGTRAALQRWAVDVERRTAEESEAGYRQKLPRQPALKVGTLVDEIVHLVETGADDPRLKWSEDRSTVTVRTGPIIPASGFYRTVEGRRQRFRKALVPALAAVGWTPGKRGGSYIRGNDGPEP